MDQEKVGRFIASLRREAGLTQEALGELVGVSNKTVSRWETGRYAPDIDTLQLLSRQFQVSLNELVAGERLDNADFRGKADEQLMAAAKASLFTLKEQEAYFTRKWRREHRALMILLAALIVLVGVWLALHWPSHAPAGVCLAVLVAHGFLNNRMRAYVEHALYGEGTQGTNREA